MQVLTDLRLCSFKGGGGIPFWEFGGNAMVTDEAVRLTDAQQSRKGHIWNTQVRILGLIRGFIPRSQFNLQFFTSIDFLLLNNGFSGSYFV